MGNENFKKVALPISPFNIVKAIWESPASILKGQNFPRRGTAVEGGTVNTSSLLGRKRNEIISENAENLKPGTHVIVYDRGLSFEESEKNLRSRELD